MTPSSSIPGLSRLVLCAAPLLAAALTMCLARGAEDRTVATPSESPRIASVQLGFKGAYKLGAWSELAVAITAGAEPFTGLVEVTAADADGVPVAYPTPVSIDHDDSAITAITYVRVGQDGAPLSVRLIDSAGREHDRRRFSPGSERAAASVPTPLTPTNQLIVTLGARDDLAAPLARGEQAPRSHVLRTARLDDSSQLPSQWYGYDGVDAVVVSTADASAFDVPADELAARVAALRQWIELGGRLVMFAGAESAHLFGAEGPLASLLPGRLAEESVMLQDFTPLEIFSGAAVTIIRAGNRLEVPRLVDVEGPLLAEGPGKLPLVVRARRGLGEITFVAVDPEAPPLEDWPERTALVRQALAWPAPAVEAAATRRAPIAADLTNQLRSALDQQFAGVSATPFAWVAALVLAYVALIGPIDYFLLRRFDRMTWTWLTFPLVVVAASAGAYALSHRVKGDELRVNQLEIVDVDVNSGQARGTVVMHLFNPRVNRYDLALEARFAGEGLETGNQRSGAQGNEENPTPSDSPTLPPPVSSLQPQPPLVSWLGVPGHGLGAMQGQRGQLAPFDEGYHTDATLAALEGVPVEQWSTKSFEATWHGAVGAVLEAKLRPLGDDQLAGRIVNRTGVRLEDCVLLRGRWAYQLPPLDDGAQCRVDETLPNATLKTLLTRVAAGDDPRVRLAADGSVPFDPLSNDVARIAKLMMFYDAIGGAAYADTPHRYLARLDLSRLLRSDHAVLLARVAETAGSQWRESSSTQLDEKQPAQTLESDADRRWTYYRFVIPLTEGNQDGPEAPVFGPAVAPSG